MLRWVCVTVCLYLALAATAFAEPVTLRPRIEASGPAVTLGDVFDGAGEVAGRAIAPAPRPGQVSTISVQVLYAAASAAGLEWTPPADLQQVRVVRPGGMAATLPPQAAGGRQLTDAAVRRGQLVAVVYQAPGITLSTRARALEDGSVGQTVRLQANASQQVIDAVVTGPGAATVSQ